MNLIQLLEQRPTVAQIEIHAQQLAQGHWKRLTKAEQQELLAEAREQLRTQFLSTEAYQQLARYFLAQEQDFIQTFASRRRRPDLVDCSFEDLVSLGQLVLLEVLAGHWGHWDHRKGPFQNFFRRALFHRFLTKLSYAGVLKTSAKKRRATIVESHEAMDGQRVSTTTKQVLSLDYAVEGEDSGSTALEDLISSSEHKVIEEQQVLHDILSRLPVERDRLMLQLLLTGLPHTEETREEARVVREAVVPMLQELGFSVTDTGAEPTVCSLLGLTTHGFRYHKRQLVKKVSKLLEVPV